MTSPNSHDIPFNEITKNFVEKKSELYYLSAPSTEFMRVICSKMNEICNTGGMEGDDHKILFKCYNSN